jgi:hypothetical protein
MKSRRAMAGSLAGRASSFLLMGCFFLVWIQRPPTVDFTYFSRRGAIYRMTPESKGRISPTVMELLFLVPFIQIAHCHFSNALHLRS